MKFAYIKNNNEIKEVILCEEDQEIIPNYSVIDVNSLEEFLEKTGVDKLDYELETIITDALQEEENTVGMSTYTIKHWVSNRSFGELIEMYENEEIVKPDMQRQFVWDSRKCSRLIESILLGLPIPPLFLLEIRPNEYEIIDGFQRINAISNFITGKTWRGEEGPASRMSGKYVVKELQKKSFLELTEEEKRRLKRSTIPLIEFKQEQPNNSESKYLIFERINTGSEKLNNMQIRRSLARGDFMQDLYQYADESENFKNLFSQNARRKDEHVEAYLRIHAMSDFVSGKFYTKKNIIKDLLNEYCEQKKNIKIPEDKNKKIVEIISGLINVFDHEDEKGKLLFRNVEISKKTNEFVYSKSVNVNILEALVGVFLIKGIDLNDINLFSLRQEYLDVFASLKSGDKDNPFSTSTGKHTSIQKRFEICDRMIEKCRL